MKKVVKFIIRLFVLALITAAFFGVPFCWFALRSQRFIWALVLTVVFGRFFCDVLCPLGILQSLVGWLRHPKAHVRRVCSRLPETRAQRVVRWTILAVFAAGLAAGIGGVTLIAPISVFGKAVSLWMPGVVLLGVVLALSLVGDGRIWCNWVCPYGTVFSLVSKFAIRKNKVGVGCGNCRRCFGEKEPAKESSAAGGVSRRETLKGVAVLAVADKLTDGGLAPVAMPGVPERECVVLPPGAGGRDEFSRKCIGCQLCVTSCPGECLKPSVSLKTFGQPVMDFRTGYCLLDCVKCSEVCPEGALQFLQREQRPNVHIGVAVWKKDRCVRSSGEECSACVRKCPVQAIHLVKGFPVIDAGACIGCGACEHVCPSRPLPAVFVQGYERQRVVNPMSEQDLVSEMKSRIAAGASVVVAKNGVIVAERKGRGIGPLLQLLDEGLLSGTIVVDKVIGRAAAAIMAKGGVVRAYALLAGAGAGDILRKNGATLTADKTVDKILNNQQNAGCPMENAVDGIEDTDKMIEAIRKARKE